MQDHKRPITVAAFEVVNIVSVLFDMVLTQTDSPFGELLTSGLLIGLVLWITRGRSRAARVMYTLIMALAAACVMTIYCLGYVPSSAKLLVFKFMVELGLTLALLWWPSTSDWLKKNRGQAAA